MYPMSWSVGCGEHFLEGRRADRIDDIWIVDLNLRVLRSLSAKEKKEIAEIREGEERNGAR